MPEISEGLGRTDALLRLVQAQEATPPPHSPPHWVSYDAGEAIPLVIVMLVAASGFACAANGCVPPLRLTPPGGTAIVFAIAISLLAAYNVLVATFVDGLQLRQAYPGIVPPRVRVGMFVGATVTCS